MIEAGQRTRARQIFARAHQFSDLPDVSEIVQCPFIQHLGEGNGSHLLVHCPPFAGHMVNLGGYVRLEGSLDMRARVLAAMTVAREFDAVYVWGAQTGSARRQGVPLLAADRQTFPFLRTASLEHEPSVFGAHANQKPVGSLAVPRVWLERALSLHDFPSAPRAQKSNCQW